MNDSVATEFLHPPGAVNLVTVQIVHGRMFARYGSAWRAKYAGVDIEVVEKDWLHELRFVSLRAIDYGLENLPLDFPPTAGQFREVCRRAPAPAVEQQQLEAPKPDPARLKAIFERLRQLRAGRKPTDWIRDLEEQQARGEPLSYFQRHCLDEARKRLGAEGIGLESSEQDKERTERLKLQTQRKVDAYERAHQ